MIYVQLYFGIGLAFTVFVFAMLKLGKVWVPGIDFREVSNIILAILVYTIGWPYVIGHSALRKFGEWLTKPKTE